MKTLCVLLFLFGLTFAEKEDSNNTPKKPIIRAYEETDTPQQSYHVAAEKPHEGQGYQSQPASSGYYYYYYPVQETHGKYPAPAPAEEHGLGAFDIFTPLVFLIGIAIFISLAFPSTFAINNARSSDSPYMIMDDLNTLSNTVVGALESEQCFNKLVCETGSIVKKIKYTDLFINLLKNYIPERYTFTVQMLKASLYDKEACQRFKCGPHPYK